jgi:hypothetical protein
LRLCGRPGHGLQDTQASMPYNRRVKNSDTDEHERMN